MEPLLACLWTCTFPTMPFPIPLAMMSTWSVYTGLSCRGQGAGKPPAPHRQEFVSRGGHRRHCYHPCPSFTQVHVKVGWPIPGPAKSNFASSCPTISLRDTVQLMSTKPRDTQLPSLLHLETSRVTPLLLPLSLTGKPVFIRQGKIMRPSARTSLGGKPVYSYSRPSIKITFS